MLSHVRNNIWIDEDGQHYCMLREVEAGIFEARKCNEAGYIEQSSQLYRFNLKDFQ